MAFLSGDTGDWQDSHTKRSQQMGVTDPFS